MSAFGDNLQAGDIHLHINVSSLAVATGILGVVGVLSGMVPAVSGGATGPDREPALRVNHTRESL